MYEMRLDYYYESTWSVVIMRGERIQGRRFFQAENIKEAKFRAKNILRGWNQPFWERNLIREVVNSYA